MIIFWALLNSFLLVYVTKRIETLKKGNFTFSKYVSQDIKY